VDVTKHKLGLVPISIHVWASWANVLKKELHTCKKLVEEGIFVIKTNNYLNTYFPL
jgi:hypothetical protein